MKIVELNGGFAICAEIGPYATVAKIQELVGGFGKTSLALGDPPYGNIVPDAWDRHAGLEVFVRWMLKWTRDYATLLEPGAAFYVWGGIGTPGFRPFFKYLSYIEERTDLNIANLITWSKKRAYGIQHNYLFCREELVYLFNGPDIKKPRVFNVPLLAEERGYEGYNKKYPAKSKFKRRTNVWRDIVAPHIGLLEELRSVNAASDIVLVVTKLREALAELDQRSNVWEDITELLTNKLQSCQKPLRTSEVVVEVHTNPGEWVLDLFGGTGTTSFAAHGLGRRFIYVEKDETQFDDFVRRFQAGERPSR